MSITVIIIGILIALLMILNPKIEPKKGDDVYFGDKE